MYTGQSERMRPGEESPQRVIASIDSDGECPGKGAGSGVPSLQFVPEAGLPAERRFSRRCWLGLYLLLNRDQKTHVFDQRPGFRRDGQALHQQVTQQLAQAAAGILFTAVGMVQAQRRLLKHVSGPGRLAEQPVRHQRRVDEERNTEDSYEQRRAVHPIPGFARGDPARRRFRLGPKAGRGQDTIPEF